MIILFLFLLVVKTIMKRRRNVEIKLKLKYRIGLYITQINIFVNTYLKFLLMRSKRIL